MAPGKIQVGSLVWALHPNEQWYAAMIVAPHLIWKLGEIGKENVLWLTDFSSTNVSDKKLYDFMDHFNFMYAQRPKDDDVWMFATKQALVEIFGADVDAKFLVRWALYGFRNYVRRPNVVPQNLIDTHFKRTSYEVRKFIRDQLKVLKEDRYNEMKVLSGKLRKGSLVWAQHSNKQWYAAYIVAPHLISKTEEAGKEYIIWLTDYSATNVRVEKICDFMSNFDLMYVRRPKADVVWMFAAKQALMELLEQMLT